MSSINNLSLLQKGLDVAWKRNQVIANNIANAETPNFKASKVDFENILKSELGNSEDASMKATNPLHMKAGGAITDKFEPAVTVDRSTSMRLDGNNVDVENEMTELAKNNLLYQTLIQKLSNEYSRIKQAIVGGK